MAVDITDLMRGTQYGARDRLSVRAIQANADDPLAGVRQTQYGTEALKALEDSPQNKNVDATATADLLEGVNKQQEAFNVLVDNLIQGMAGKARSKATGGTKP